MTNKMYTSFKTQRSPFAIFKDERLNVINVNKSKSSDLDDLDKLILIGVDQLLVTTSYLLHTNLVNIGLKNVDQDTLKKSIKRLTETGYLTKMEFITPTSCGNTKVYTLAKLGQDYMRSMGRTPQLTGYISSLDALHCKRLLAAQQFIISQKYSSASSITIGGIVVERKDNNGTATNNIFRPQGIIQFPDKTIFVEAVRTNWCSADELIQKLQRINTTLRNSRYLNIPVREKTSVVIVCESYEHMTNIREYLDDVKEKYCFDIILTNDIDVYNNSSNCLYPFEQTGRMGKFLSAVRKGWHK